MDPFDWTWLMDNCAHDEALVREVLSVFRREAPPLLAEVRGAVKAHDAPGIKRSAHRLKGALVTIGARPSVAAAVLLETSARDGDLSDADLGLAHLEFEMHLLLRAVAPGT